MISEVNKIYDLEFDLFKQGNEKVFEKIFNENYNALVGFASQMINDYETSKSIAQEAFINLWKNRNKVNQQNGIKSFLYTSVKSSCLDFLRHKKIKLQHLNKRLEERENDLNTEILETIGFESYEFKELENIIQASIDALPEKCKMVFIKSRFENKKNKEIAEELGIAVKSVEANITRALKILKTNLSHLLMLFLVA